MIRNRGGYWQVRVYAGLDPRSGRKRHLYDRATSQVAARALEARLRADVHRERTRPHTVAQLLDHWLAWAEHVRELAPTTLVGYRHYAHRILTPRLGHFPVTAVTTGHLEQLYAQLRRTGAVRGTPLAASTVRSIHSVVNSAFTRAVVWGWATTNPALPATLPQSRTTEVIPPTVEQVIHLLDHAHSEDPVLAMLVRLAAVTGARRGELCALRWTDVDWDHGELVIVRTIAAVPGRGLLIRPTKNRTRRRVALDARTMALLRAHRARVEQAAARSGVPLDPDGYLVAATTDGAQPLHPDDCTTRFRHLRGRAKLTCRLHDLRHFMATQLLVNGVDLRTVAGRAGHADPSTTLKAYTHFVPAADHEAASLMTALLDGAEEAPGLPHGRLRQR